jgi:hypothetical protein
MTAALGTLGIFILLLIGVTVALMQHERDLKRGTVTDPERTPLWWAGIILVLVLSAYSLATENDARIDAQEQAARSE